MPWGGGGAAGPPPVRPCEREGSAPESARPGAPGDAGARHPSAPASPGPRPAHTAGKPGGKELEEQTRDARQRARERRPLRTCQKGPVCTGPGRLHRAPGGSAWEERAREECTGRTGREEQARPRRAEQGPFRFPSKALVTAFLSPWGDQRARDQDLAMLCTAFQKEKKCIKQ